MPSAHAPYGPSRIPMYLRCPGSVQFAQKVGERRDSKAAAEGTAAHHIREMCLVFGMDPEDFKGQEVVADGFTFEVDDDMVDHLRPGIEWIEERPGRLINEYQVDLSRWVPGQFGTLDVGIIAPDLITINDLKYGMGVEVDPVRHEPTMAYALGLWDNVARHETDATEFLIVIDQPRIRGAGGEWRVSLDELLEFGERLKEGFEAAQAEDPPLVPGEKQCLFCPAKAVCPAYQKWAMDLIDLEFDDMDEEQITLSNADDFTAAQRALIARHKTEIEKWLRAVYAKVAGDAHAGRPTPGLKLVRGRKGARFWKDAEAAAAILEAEVEREDLYKPAPIISPTEVEKLAKKKKIHPDAWDDLQGLIGQMDGRPSLVDEADKKPALDVTDEFDDLEEDVDFDD